MNYTYILRCADGTLYTGWTNDIEKRLAAHNAGTASKYTRVRRPVELVYLEEHESKNEAMSREWHIKRLSRNEKMELINKNQGFFAVPTDPAQSYPQKFRGGQRRYLPHPSA